MCLERLKKGWMERNGEIAAVGQVRLVRTFPTTDFWRIGPVEGAFPVTQHLLSTEIRLWTFRRFLNSRPLSERISGHDFLFLFDPWSEPTPASHLPYYCPEWVKHLYLPRK